MERLLLEFCIRASLIVSTTAVVLRILRIKIAAAQHAVWAGVLVAMLLLPVWLAWGPKASVPVLPARGEPAVVMIPAAPLSVVTAESSMPAVISEPAPATIWNWNAVLLSAYLTGAFVLLLRLTIGTIRANGLTSASCAAPVTVGFLRSRIILPQRSTEWSQAQLDAVLTHEHAHVRRRDPLFQWLALLNRAVFWFHPLAWWLERELSALAEEACDAAVLERGHDPREYSQYLLDLAREVRRAGTRVNVVAMAMPGSYLPQRVKQIIEGVRAPRLSRVRLVCAALACAIPAVVFAAGTLDHASQILRLPLPATPVPQPVLLAQAPAQAKAPEAPPPKLVFEVASVRSVERLTDIRARGGHGGPGTSDPERFTFAGLLADALRIAYGVDFDQISGPEWLQTERYEIAAKVPPGATKEQMNAMLQNLLADRFHLSFHRVAKEFPQYELVIAKGGLKLKENTDANLAPTLPGDRGKLPDRDGFPQIEPGKSGVQNATADGLHRMTARGVPLSYLLFEMGAFLGDNTGPNTYAPARIVDKTGLTGNYDFNLEFAGLIGPGAYSRTTPDAPAPDLIEAIEKQLGLKLQKTMAPVDILVIDHIEKIPTEN